MRIRQIFFLFILSFCCLSFKGFAQEDMFYGIVNFSNCLMESKYGKQEQEAFENITNQFTTLINDIEKEIKDIKAKLNDSEFMDTLSPQAEQDFKDRLSDLHTEVERYQNQYVQVAQQANEHFIQTMKHHVSKASDAVAKKKNLSMVMHESTCLFYQPGFDITCDVIEEMNKNFDKDNQKLLKTD